MSDENEKKSDDAPPTTRLGRAWRRSKAFGKGVTGLSAFGAALVAISAWFPLAQDNLWPKEKEYKVLADIHAGYSVDYVKSKLGMPVELHPITGQGPKLTLMVFPHDDYLASVVADEAGEVQVYSVLSCSADFKPQFETPDRKKVTLQTGKLTDVEQGQDPNFVRLSYQFAGEGQVEQAVEVEQGSGTNVLDGMSVLYGANGVCSQELPPLGMTHTDASYDGLLKGAPPSIRAERGAITPNFYTELAPRFDLRRLVKPLPGDTAIPDPLNATQVVQDVPPTPGRAQIPPSFLAKHPLAGHIPSPLPSTDVTR